MFTQEGWIKRVLNDWSAALFKIFKLGPHQIREVHSRAPVFKLVLIEEYLSTWVFDEDKHIWKEDGGGA